MQGLEEFVGLLNDGWWLFLIPGHTNLNDNRQSEGGTLTIVIRMISIPFI